MKQLIPWPMKFGMKLMFGLTRVDYRLLKRLRLVEHGRMEDPGFSREIFQLHVEEPRRHCGVGNAGALLELGPGDSVATGVLGRAAGFQTVDLVDVGCFADLRPQAVNSLFTGLGAASPGIDLGADGTHVRSRLSEMGIQYMTDGLASLRSLAPGSIGHSFSNTVLQHVYCDDIPELIRLLGRAHASSGLASHSVNFTDHFSGGFLNHTLPQWLMESALIKRANLYTNRVPSLQYLQLFEAAGLRVRRLSVDFFDGAPPARVEYHSGEEFRRHIGSRPILRTIFLMQKA